jgi:hypothetical protein
MKIPAVMVLAMLLSAVALGQAQAPAPESPEAYKQR